MDDGLTIEPRIHISRSDDERARWSGSGDIKTVQKFAAIHASIHNHFNQDRHLNRRDIFKQNRSAVLAEWRQLAALEAWIVGSSVPIQLL